MERRQLILALGTVPLLGLGACTGPYNVYAEVSSFGEWPADKSGGTYAFERLPSQKQSKRHIAIEEAAREAFERAGLKPAAEGQEADYKVSVGMRYSLSEPAIWDDPLWWRGRASFGWGYGRRGALWWNRPGPGPWSPFDVRYNREAAVLIRDGKTGEPIYESHASNDGINMGDNELAQALFLAAMAEFPKAESKSHRVSVMMPGQPPKP